MKKFLKEFKEFALKGNVMNLAVGVIIGSAFSGIVTSLTENILSPILGLLTRQNFDSLEVSFWGVTLKYGMFITSVFNFIIIAFVIFLLVRIMNKIIALGDKKTEEKPTTKKCPYCKTDIHLEATRCPACTSELQQNQIIK